MLIKDGKWSAVSMEVEHKVLIKPDLGIIKQYGLEYIGPITGDISGKRNIDKNRQNKITE